MTTERHERLSALFLEASKLDGADRAAFLDSACEDDLTLRAEVEAMLRHDADDEHDALAPGRGAHALADALSERSDELAPGCQVDEYTIVDRLGEGGFATVYRARQEEPVCRQVALKVIKPGMDSHRILKRFEAERQTLARMNHAHIARMFDAGAMDDGRPYFVMEYIEGAPVTTVCREQNLSITDRLNLFRQVCSAVQHAHQNGIIHRDIKPSNVLVARSDGALTVKVIDFGIAKAITRRVAEGTVFTEHGQLIGTPEYMSPEQAAGQDIDTRTDVYALGVLLYELLVGAPPFDLRNASFIEICNTIRDIEPPKPSTRVGMIGRDAGRGDLQSTLRGDLDWVVLRAITKERDLRYETASALADDIARYQADEPVTASPPSATYRVRKFVRRNRAGVAMAAVALLILVVGMIGTIGGLLSALEEKERAYRAATAAERAAERAEAINAFVTTTLQSSDAMTDGGRQDMTILEAMNAAVADLDAGRFDEDPEIEADLKTTIGLILFNNGRSQEAEPLLASALEIRTRLHPGDHAEVAQSMDNLGLVRVDLGEHAAAADLHTAALAMRRQLFDGDHRAIATSLYNLAVVRGWQGEYDDAEALHREALAMRERLLSGDHEELAVSLDGVALACERLGRGDEAIEFMLRGLDMWRRLHDGDHPDVARSINNLAFALRSVGQLTEAEDLLVEALDMKQRLYAGDHPTLATAAGNLASIRKALGKLADAEVMYRQSLDMTRRLYEGDHPDLSLRLMNHAAVLQDLERYDEAESSYLEALAMDRRLFPGDHPYVAGDLNNLASLYKDLERYDDAERMYAEALEMRQRIYQEDHPRTANSIAALASVHQKLGRVDEARAGFDASIAMFCRLAPTGIELLPFILCGSGEAWLEAGEIDAALRDLEEAVSLAEGMLPDDHPKLARYRESLERARAAARENAG